MMVRWRCKACGFVTMVLPELKGKKVRCPKCGAMGEVPGGVAHRIGKLQQVKKEGPQEENSSKESNRNILLAVAILAAGVVVALVLILALG